MRLLNLHPQVYISNESDVVWVVYQFHKNGGEFKDYPHDSPAGMRESLQQARHILDKEKSPRENFIAYQTYLMENGFMKMKPMDKPQLRFIGDQKPYQNSDPDLLPFIMEMFPEAKFLHILRHPFPVASSSRRFGGGTGGYIWKGMNNNELIQKWVFHERWIDKMKDAGKYDMREVRYGHLVEHTEKEMAGIFDFLGLEYDSRLLKKCRFATLPNFKPVENYAVTDDLKHFLKEYGMPEKFGSWEGRHLPSIKNLYYRIYLKARRTLTI